MFDFSIMSQEDYPFSDLDFLLSKDNITEDDLLQLPEVPLKNQKHLLTIPPLLTSYRASPSHQLTNLPLPLTLDPGNENQLPPHDNCFINRRKAMKPLPNILLPKTLSSNLT